MKRPEPPKTHDPYKRESYEEYNRYFNEAEKYIDFKEDEVEACNERNWAKREKLEKLIQIFYDQPSNIIQWTPDKQYYSWGFATQTRAQKILEEILEILVEETTQDETKKRAGQ